MHVLRRLRDAGRRPWRSSPVTTITAQATSPTTPTQAQPARRRQGHPDRSRAPRFERDDDRERDDDEREQEVRHDERAGGGRGSTVIAPSGLCATVPRNTASASQTTQRGSPATRRDACQVASVARIVHDRDHPVAELDHRVVALRGKRRSSRSGASCRSRAPSRSAGRSRPTSTTRPRSDRRVPTASLQEAVRRQPSSPQARAMSAHEPASADRRRPPRRAPTRCRSSRRRRTSPRARAPCRAASVTSRPPAVCGSYASAASSSATPSLSTCGPANSRLRRSPPVRVAARCELERARQRGQPVGVERDADAAALGGLVRVAEQAEAGDVGHGIRRERPQRVGGVAVQRRHRHDRGVECASGARPSRTAWRTSPVPSGFVRKTASPGRAPLFRQTPSGWTVPTTARPYFGSSSRIVCPPARIAPAAAHRSVRSREHRRRASRRQLLRERGTRARAAALPPIAKTSLSAFVAAIRPKCAGSSTSGGKKSTVKTSAGARRAGRRPRRPRDRGRRAGPPPPPERSPSSSSSSRAAEYFAAQPPPSRGS